MLKFGGTSVCDTHNIRVAAALAEKALEQTDRLAVVVSALSGTTDELIALSRSTDRLAILEALRDRHLEVARQLADVATSRSVASLLRELETLVDSLPEKAGATAQQDNELSSFGELLSAPLVAAALRERGLNAAACDLRPLVRTKHGLGVTRVDHRVTFSALRQHFRATKKILVATGFVASNQDGQATTLGRGGSDLTAALLGAALDAEEIEIWTDVDGVLSADPRVVHDAFSIPELSYEEIMELAHFGAKVLYPPSVNPARERNIPLRIRNTQNPDFAGTLITSHKATSPRHAFTGITAVPHVTLLTLAGSGMVGVTGTAHRFFGALASAACNVILISQASSEHTICCAVEPDDANRAQAAVDQEFERERRARRVRPLRIETDLSVVAVIGEGMRERPGIAARVFSVLAESNINVRAIAQGSSERNISVVLNTEARNLAVRALHAELFSRRGSKVRRSVEIPLPLEVVVAGVGGVGAALLELVLAEPKRLRLAGVLNSKHQLLQTIEPKNAPADSASWRSHLRENGVPVEHQRLAAQLPQDGVFVDCTASSTIAALYTNLLATGTSVVAANKLAVAADTAKGNLVWQSHTAVHSPGLPREPGSSPVPEVAFEATVGAGLPIVSTLCSLLDSGDQILEISGVFSGTLGFLLSSLRSGLPQSEAIRQAFDGGLTEPDPRDDLSGADVARKLLILARLCGAHLDLCDVTIEPLVPSSPHETLEEFWTTLPTMDQALIQQLAQATEQGKTLAYLAHADFQSHPQGRPRLTVGLQEIPEQHPAAQLQGTDNLFLFRTQRYDAQPLLVRGPGAGVGVTAAGVLGDLLALHRRRSRFPQECST